MVLVIGFGNELRRDDGLGPLLARLAASWQTARTRCLDAHQLTPEMAVQVADAERALFVDAAASDAVVCLQRVMPADTMETAHALRPETLLALARLAWGKCPHAWLLSVPGQDFSFGTELSPFARDQLPQAADLIRDWLTKPDASCTKPA